jgi:hypothetical protein
VAPAQEAEACRTGLGRREPPRRAAGPRCQPEPFEGNALTAARRPS